MSEYESIVGGKLKLKGKALDVKAGGVRKKKKKKQKEKYDQGSQLEGHEVPADGTSGQSTDPDPTEDVTEAADKVSEEGHPAGYKENLTPAEKRYIEQRDRIDMHRLAKTANKSHRDRIQDFNQYLANLSEHYDIPKVGPG